MTNLSIAVWLDTEKSHSKSGHGQNCRNADCPEQLVTARIRRSIAQKTSWTLEITVPAERWSSNTHAGAQVPFFKMVAMALML